MLLLARAILIALDFAVLASPSRLGGGLAGYIIATVLIVAVNAALIVSWRRPMESWRRPMESWRRPIVSWRPPIQQSPIPNQSAIRNPNSAITAAVALLAGAVLFLAGRSFLHEILIHPHDSQRADMLIVIQQGIHRLLQGRDPYTMYKVPWDATLPYGPVMWAPFIVPYVLHVDIRFVTILGELFIPVACALAALAAATNLKLVEAAAWLIVSVAITTSADVLGFTSIGHTPAYWPLLALCAWLVAREKWNAAAITVGLLIVARTTMVAIAPVLVMAIWHRHRRGTMRATLLLVAAAIVPYLPFALWDWRSLEYALYGSYVSLMKGFVWTSTDWVQHSVGITGLLLRAGLSRFVEPLQIVVMISVYAIGWPAIARGRPPVAWMAAALLAFSMTTLWPVGYIYLDVFLLLASAALADSTWLLERSTPRAWAACLAVAAFALVATTVADVPRDATLDFGIGATRWALYSGFANDEGSIDRTFVWVDGTRAEMLVPRRSRAHATIELECEPFLPTRVTTQEMNAVLNGVLLGTVRLREGWQSVAFEAPPRAWQIGVNELVLSFSSAAAPRDFGDGDDGRKLSVAFDRLTVRSR